MDVFDRALKAFCDTLADESGGGVNFSSPLDPREIAGAALFLRDGRVAVLASSGTADAAPPSPQGEGIGGGEL